MSSQPSEDFIIYKPPSRPSVDKLSLILYGSISQDTTTNWQNDLASSLSDLPIAILNPHRDDWDSTWIEDISFPKFKEQVEWEMDYAKVADIIVFYFGATTLAPISLLELGMYAGTGKVVVCCEKEFKKKGNVQMVCHRYDIPLMYSLDELKEKVRQKVVDKLKDSARV
jgi:hypothetical protein